MNKIMKHIFGSMTGVMAVIGIAAANPWQNPNTFQSPQQWYSNNPRMISAPQSGFVGHPQQGAWVPPNQQQRPHQSQGGHGKTADSFSWSVGLSQQYSHYGFDMNETGSILTWSDVIWNVFDVSGRYVKDSWVFNAGLQYGVQFGTSKMTDNDRVVFVGKCLFL